MHYQHIYLAILYKETLQHTAKEPISAVSLPLYRTPVEHMPVAILSFKIAIIIITLLLENPTASGRAGFKGLLFMV